MFNVTAAWKTAYPGAAAGILVMRRAANPEGHPALERRIGELEAQLRARFRALPRPCRPFGLVPKEGGDP